MPVGSTTRLLSFLSGGLDSPVATWLMIRRGARVSGVHFHNRTLQGAAVREKIEDLCGTLAWSAGQMPLLIVPFEASQRAIVASVPADYRMIVYRRAMFRIGSALARQEKMRLAAPSRPNPNALSVARNDDASGGIESRSDDPPAPRAQLSGGIGV